MTSSCLKNILQKEEDYLSDDSEKKEYEDTSEDFFLFLKEKHLNINELDKLWEEFSQLLKTSKKETKTFSKKPKEIYVDGAVKNNQLSNKKSVKGGIGVFSEDYKYNISQSFTEATNNKMELQAILKALTILEQEKEKEDTIIFSDSIYSIKCCTIWYKTWKTNDWKTSKGYDVLNKELIIEIVSKLEKMNWVKIKYVKAHNGNHGNEIADKLANEKI